MQITEITPKAQSEERIRLAAYCRVSSDSEDQLHSLASQIRWYSDYGKRNPQYQIVDIYADEGLSGTEMENRDELQRLLKDCRRGKIDRIITKTVSRFARNTEELLATLRMLKEFGVSVFFEKQGIDTAQLNMEMIVTFPGMAAQQESEAISGNVRWGVKRRMENGDYIISRPAYGYILKDKKIVINEDEAKVIRRIFDLYLHGMGTQQITDLLNREKVPTSNRKKGAGWGRNAVRYILHNEKYMGDAIFQKHYTTETLPYRRIRNNGEKPMYYTENYNPPIIDENTFNAAQNLIKQKAEREKGQKTSSSSMKLYCPECGRLFGRQTLKGHNYWNCSKLTSNRSKCKSRRVREDMVCHAFLTMTYKLKAHRCEILDELIQQMENLRTITGENSERIRQIDKQIADLCAKRLVVARLHTNGVLGMAEYSTQDSEMGDKINRLRTERRKKLSEDENDMAISELKALNDEIKDYSPSSVFNAELFDRIVEKIIVKDNSCLIFHLIGGLTLTEKIKEKGRCKTK